ncbi:tyrosine-type recombinase/integrase [Flavobacterium sp. Arc2]|jgi:integrase/recombinase XerD|uniref:tyrosine-type recombinase/integrase n=1 Tax=Flavobacterium sp. Arc2 TaxID=3046685 RepID=UPI00352D1D32
MRDALKKSGLTKKATVHTLQHSFTTYLLESDTDIYYTEELLAHSSSKTTEIYTRVSTKSLQQIKSQFDDSYYFIYTLVQ